MSDPNTCGDWDLCQRFYLFMLSIRLQLNEASHSLERLESARGSDSHHKMANEKLNGGKMRAHQ